MLLDLDGTLADTAPDLAAAANRMRAARGIEPLPVSELRPYVSHGARGMVRFPSRIRRRSCTPSLLPVLMQLPRRMWAMISATSMPAAQPGCVP